MSNKYDVDNRANQLNPNNSAYLNSRENRSNSGPYEDDEDFCESVSASNHTYSSSLVAQQTAPSGPRPTFEGFSFPLLPVKVNIHYVGEHGESSSMLVEAGSVAEIVAEAQRLWSQNRLFYLKVFKNSEVHFFAEQDVELARPEVQRQVKRAVQKAKDYWGPQSEFSIHPFLMSRRECEAKNLASYILR